MAIDFNSGQDNYEFEKAETLRAFTGEEFRKVAALLPRDLDDSHRI